MLFRARAERASHRWSSLLDIRCLWSHGITKEASHMLVSAFSVTPESSKTRRTRSWSVFANGVPRDCPLALCSCLAALCFFLNGNTCP